MKNFITLLIFILLSSNLFAAGSDSSGSSGGGEDVSKSNYKQAVSLIKRAGKLEKKDKTDKAIKLYSQAFDKLEPNLDKTQASSLKALADLYLYRF